VRVTGAADGLHPPPDSAMTFRATQGRMEDKDRVYPLRDAWRSGGSIVSAPFDPRVGAAVAKAVAMAAVATGVARISSKFLTEVH